jgi:hypothetical protein
VVEHGLKTKQIMTPWHAHSLFFELYFLLGQVQTFSCTRPASKRWQAVAPNQLLQCSLEQVMQCSCYKSAATTQFGTVATNQLLQCSLEQVMQCSCYKSVAAT